MVFVSLWPGCRSDERNNFYSCYLASFLKNMDCLPNINTQAEENDRRFLLHDGLFVIKKLYIRCVCRLGIACEHEGDSWSRFHKGLMKPLKFIEYHKRWSRSSMRTFFYGFSTIFHKICQSLWLNGGDSNPNKNVELLYARNRTVDVLRS